MSPALPRPAELRAIALDAARAVVGDLAAAFRSPTAIGPEAKTTHHDLVTVHDRHTEARPIASYGAPAPGTLGGVYPDYDDRVFPGLVAAQELAGIDVDYLRNVDRVSEAGIAEASLADLGTLFTYLVRGERFADGHVAAAIENGKVGRMLDRLTALVPEIR